MNELTISSGKIAHESSFKFAKFNKYKGISYSNKDKLFFIWNSNLIEHLIFYPTSLHLGGKKPKGKCMWNIKGRNEFSSTIVDGYKSKDMY